MRVTVTILDNCGDPVSGALVEVTFTGDFSQVGTGTTNTSGVVTIGTTYCVRKPSWTGTVTNVTGPLPYDPSDNVTDNCSM